MRGRQQTELLTECREDMTVLTIVYLLSLYQQFSFGILDKITSLSKRKKSIRFESERPQIFSYVALQF